MKLDHAPPRVYYYGALSKENLGHFFYDDMLRNHESPAPCFERIEYFPPQGYWEDRQGYAAVTYIEGWSVISMWDRTADHRFKSNSSFLVEMPGLDPETIMEIAKEHFPEIVERIGRITIVSV